MTTFSYSSGDPNNLVASANASMADIQGPFVDLRSFLNGSISSVNLASNAGIQESQLASGSSGMAAGTFSVYRTTNVALSAGVGTQVQFNAEDFDVSGWYDSGATFRYTPQIPGYYLFTAMVNLTSVTDSAGCQVALRKNGVQWKVLGQGGVSGLALTPAFGGSARASANGTTDYFDVTVNYTGAGASIGGGAGATYFQGNLIGRT